MHSSSHDGRDRDGASCSTVRDLLHLFTEGEIDPIRARLVQAHLEGCGSCREERGALDEERLWLVEAMVKSPPLSSRLRGKVVDRIRQRERVERSRKRWTFLVRASGLAAAAALAVGLGIALRGGGTGAEPPLVARNDPPAVSSTILPASSTILPASSTILPASSTILPASPTILPASPAMRPLPSPAILPPVPVEDSPAAPVAGEEVEVRFASARAPSFGDVLGIVRRIGPAEAPFHPGEPCPPDPNKDGKVDFIDVAYSCQIIMGAPPPHALGEVDATAVDPECVEDCLRV